MLVFNEHISSRSTHALGFALFFSAMMYKYLLIVSSYISILSRSFCFQEHLFSHFCLFTCFWCCFCWSRSLPHCCYHGCRSLCGCDNCCHCWWCFSLLAGILRFLQVDVVHRTHLPASAPTSAWDSRSCAPEALAVVGHFPLLARVR